MGLELLTAQIKSPMLYQLTQSGAPKAKFIFREAMITSRRLHIDQF